MPVLSLISLHSRALAAHWRLFPPLPPNKGVSQSQVPHRRFLCVCCCSGRNNDGNVGVWELLYFARTVLPELRKFDAGAAIDRSRPLPDLRFAAAAAE